MVSGVADDVVASTVRTEVETGVVVPIALCPTPRTAPDTCENASDEICCRGESVSYDDPFDDTSICK